MGGEKYIKSFNAGGRKLHYFSLKELEREGKVDISELPFSVAILVESALRNAGSEEGGKMLEMVAGWKAGKSDSREEIPFKVSRILMQDFTGIPAVVDLAAMRDVVKKNGMSPKTINPSIRVDLVVDHSIQVDSFGKRDSAKINEREEMRRNRERYSLLKWAGKAFKGFNVVPPSTGICHQVNLEYLATCVSTEKKEGVETAFPDTLVGTDSHTTMINALGVFGFGVGGIEAEAALLGEPIPIPMPEVVGVRLEGRLGKDVTAMDLSLSLTRILREKGVVGKFVEFYGKGLRHLQLQDRATISNMCPEYGATVAIFPVDSETLRYLRGTGRKRRDIELVRRYYKLQGLFGRDQYKVKYTSHIEVDLSTIAPACSGPNQPKQAMGISRIGRSFSNSFLTEKGGGEKMSHYDYTRWGGESMVSGNGMGKAAAGHRDAGEHAGRGNGALKDGDIVIAAITSCTNTSNPVAMVGAGILARNAVRAGLQVPRTVKTSFAPGSRVVTTYLERAGLMRELEKLGFSLVGYGCTTCIGNSGPLPDGISKEIRERDLAVASVLSGNRNYEARIHPDVKANYLMSPPLVVAYALAGTVMTDLSVDPIGIGKGNRKIYLKDIWPDRKEITRTIEKVTNPREFTRSYSRIYKGNTQWNVIKGQGGDTYRWDGRSTYIAPPRFIMNPSRSTNGNLIQDARILAVYGDSVSTDHISPAGAISKESPAGRYLISKGVKPGEFNTYGSRRGNDRVMERGTFANQRIKNIISGEIVGGGTIHFPDNKKMDIYDAAEEYRKKNIPLLIIAGEEYGSGSSRDWAAKGPALLGIKAIIAKSFERIHRSNLAGMGILPLQFGKGKDAGSLDIDFGKTVSIDISKLAPKGKAVAKYTDRRGRNAEAELTIMLYNEREIEYYRAGGVLNYVLEGMINGKK